MSDSPRPKFTFLLAATFVYAGTLAVCFQAQAQVVNQDQEIFVQNLPIVKASSQDPSDILLASLETVFHDQNVCCGRNSSLRDSVQAADAGSLRDVAAKLEGRHRLGDGRTINVTANYVAADAIRGAPLIAMLMNERAALIEWNSHLYVLRGVVYRWIESGDPTSVSKTTVIHKLLLWDTRFSDSRRDVVFDRTKDDWSKVQGLLVLQSLPQ